MMAILYSPGRSAKGETSAKYISKGGGQDAMKRAAKAARAADPVNETPKFIYIEVRGVQGERG
jgi:hypothetical protein